MSDLGTYFDELDRFDEAKQALDRSIRASQQVAPEVAARQRQLAAQTGIPAAVIPDFQKQAEEEASVRQVQRLDLPRTAPATAAWLANPANAAIARDDAEKLSFLERMGNALSRGFKALDQGGSAVAAKSNARTLANLDDVEKRMAAGQAIADAEDLLGARFMSPEDRKALRESLTSAIGGSATNIVRRQQEIAAGPQMDPIVARASNAKSLSEFWYFFSQKPVEFIATIGAESLPQSLPGLAAGVAGGIAAGPAGAMLGFGAGSFGTDYGASVVEAMRDAGVDLGSPEAIKAALADKALMARVGQRAFAHAAPVAVFDAASGGLATKTLAPALKSAALRQAINLPVQSVAQGVAGAAGEAAGQVASGQDLSAGQIMAEFFGEFATAPGEVVSMTAARGREAYRSALRSMETKATLDAMAQASDQSALLKRDPEAFRAALEQITRGTEAETLYVPIGAWQTLFQDANPRAIAQEVLGPLASRYDEALATGGDLAIPTADVMAKLAPTKFWQALSEDVRTAPDEMTPREARAFAQVRSEAEAQVGTADVGGVNTDAIRAEVTGQLVSSGVERGAAEKQASLYEAFFRTLAERLGTDPIELWKRYTVNIRRQLPDVLTKLNSVDMTLDPILDNLRAGKVPQQKDIFGPSLIEWLRGKGGLQDTGGELKRMEVDLGKRPFQRNLVQANGMQLDLATEAAIEAGYLPAGATQRELLDAIDTEMRGSAVFSPQNEDQRLRTQADAMDALDAALQQAGIDLKQTSNAEIARMLQQAMGQEGAQTLDQGAALHLDATIDVDGKQRPTTNSQGRPIAATEEAVRNFWRWFGDSKVVDAEGRPRVMYHGTASDITQFDRARLGSNTEARSARLAFFFTSSASVAEGYAKLASPAGDELGNRLEALWKGTEDPVKRKLIQDRMAAVAEQAMADWRTFNETDTVGGANLLPVYLRLTEPLVQDYGGQEYREFSFSELLQEARDEGRDGVIFTNARDAMHKLHDEPSDIVAVFDPTQIKSATGNAGTFDPTNPSILAQDQRGQIQFVPGARRFDITLMETADLSTFLHETGHFFLEVFREAVNDPAATPALRQDWQTLLDWFGVQSADQIGVDQHEQFARGFEAYLMEGKAPSPALAAPFARFRAWLVSLYRSLTQLNVTLTDEVRGVMDRLLAADDEIALASTKQWMVPMFESAEKAGMTPEQFAAYRDLVDKARQAAKDDLTQKTMAAVRRETQDWYREARAKVRAEVAAEVNAEPVYQALAFLQRGKQADGSALPDGQQPLKIAKQALVDQYGEAFLKRLPKPYVYAREGGVHHSVVAELFGFSSGDALVQALIEARPKNEVIDAETDVRMRDTYGDVATDGTIAEEAMASVHNDQQAKLLLTELRHLGGQAKRQAPTALGVLREAARGIVARKQIRELKPAQYQRDEARAGREAFEAAAKGDYNRAFLAKQRQTFAHLLYTEAIRAQDAADKAQAFARSLLTGPAQQRLGKAGGTYLDQVNALLERFEWKRVSVATLDRRQSLLEWVIAQGEQGNEPDIPANVLDEAFRKNWRELTVEELAGVRDSLDAIVHASRLKNRLLRNKAARDLEAAEDLAEATIIGNSKGARPRVVETRAPGQKTIDMIGGFFAAHRKAANLIREMDGFADGGPLSQLFLQPVNEAANEEATLTAQTAAKLNELAKLLDGKRLHDKREFKAAGVSLSRNGAIAVALNWGNLDNRKKLLEGYGWTEAAGKEIIDSLDAQEWQFVQGMWDLIDSFWPEIAAKEKRVTGLAPEKVEAAPFETPHGRMRGGYYPIRGDDRQSATARHLDAKTAAEQMMRGMIGHATTRRGHTKARTEGAQHVIRLDIGVATEHLTQVIHDLTHHEMLIDMNRLLNSKRISEAIIAHYGHQPLRQLESWVTDIAAGHIPAQSTMEAGWSYLRNGVVSVGMAWNLSTAALQALGFTQSAVRVGSWNMAQALSRFVASPEQSIAWVHERSPMMANRALTQNREINDIRNRLVDGRIDWLAARYPGAEHLRNAVGQSYFTAIAKMQMLVDVPTWLAGYEKAIRAGASEEQAIAQADQVVIDAQGGGQFKDLAQVQRGSPIQKLFSTFYSYFNVTWNLWVDSVKRTDFRKPGDVGRLAVDFALLYVVPAVMGSLLKDLLKGDPPEDWEEFQKKAARETLSYMTGSLIGVRELSGVIQGGFDYSGPAGTRFFSEASRLVKQAFQGDVDEPLLRAGNSVLGMIFHYPAGQIDRSVRGYLAWQEGTAPISAVIFGPPKD